MWMLTWQALSARPYRKQRDGVAPRAGEERVAELRDGGDLVVGAQAKFESGSSNFSFKR